MIFLTFVYFKIIQIPFFLANSIHLKSLVLIGLKKRNQHDHKAVVELDKVLRSFDKKDPVKYDFALFGIGVFEKNYF